MMICHDDPLYFSLIPHSNFRLGKLTYNTHYQRMHLVVAPFCKSFLGIFYGCIGGEAYARLRSDYLFYGDDFSWYKRDWLAYNNNNHGTGWVSEWGAHGGVTGPGGVILLPGYLTCWPNRNWYIPQYIWFEFDASLYVSGLKVLGIEGAWVYKGNA